MALPRDVAETWLRKLARDTTFEQAMQNRRFRHPSTGNHVLFVSLPPEEQAKIRALYDRQRAQEAEGDATSKKGPWTERVLEKAKEAVDATTQAGKNLIKFIQEPEYRTEVKNAFVAKKKDFKEKLDVELRESKEMLSTFGQVLAGQDVQEDARNRALDQLKDLGKMAVLGTVTVAPLGPLDDIILMALTAGVKLAFPEFSWLPSAWRTATETPKDEDLAGRIVDRLYEGVLKALEDAPEQILLQSLEQVRKSRE